jgi:hypothetical protein
MLTKVSFILIFYLLNQTIQKIIVDVDLQHLAVDYSTTYRCYYKAVSEDKLPEYICAARSDKQNTGNWIHL